jgi:hypothetical protein
MSGSTAPTPVRGNRLLVAGIAVLAIAVVAVVLTRERAQPDSVPEQVTATYLEAWNDRDAQAVSELTCQWNPAFTPAGVVENRFASEPEGPSVEEYTVTGTTGTRLSDREVVAVHVEYVRKGEGRSRQATVYVLVDGTDEPCLAALTTW